MVQPSATRKGQDLPSATDGNLCLEKVAIRQACLSHCYLLDKLRNNETVQTEDGLICFLLIWGNLCQNVDSAKGMDDEYQFHLLAMYRVNCVKVSCYFHLSSVARGGNSVTYPPFSFVKGGVILELTPHCLVFMKERDSQQRDLPSAAETHSRCFGLRRDFVVFGNQIFFHKSNIPYLWFLEENSQGHSASVSDR